MRILKRAHIRGMVMVILKRVFIFLAWSWGYLCEHLSTWQGHGYTEARTYLRGKVMVKVKRALIYVARSW